MQPENAPKPKTLPRNLTFFAKGQHLDPFDSSFDNFVALKQQFFPENVFYVKTLC